MTNAQNKIEKLEREGIPAKEIIKEIQVSKVSRVEPIKEITKEIITEKIPSEELTQIKKELGSFAAWGTDIENLRNIAKKLQANPANVNVPTAPIYIGSRAFKSAEPASFLLSAFLAQPVSLI